MHDLAEFLWRIDRELFLLINGLSSPVLDPLLGWTTYLGNPLLLLAVIFAGCLVWDRRGILKTYPWIFFAVGGARVAAHLVKEWTHRSRPSFYFAEEVHTLFGPYQGQTSFPSGHATAAFAAVTALCLIYGKKWRMLYGIAALVALSRVYVGAHFPSDVLAGAVLGWIAARMILVLRRIN